MANYILFGIYAFVLIIIFGYIAIFLRHIRDYRQYSHYITPITRMYLIIIISIGIIGAYYTLSGTIFPQSQAPAQRINL